MGRDGPAAVVNNESAREVYGGYRFRRARPKYNGARSSLGVVSPARRRVIVGLSRVNGEDFPTAIHLFLRWPTGLRRWGRKISAGSCLRDSGVINYGGSFGVIL